MPNNTDMHNLVQKVHESVIIKNIIKNKLVERSREQSCSINDVRRALVEFLDVTPTQYSRWENNTSQPNLEYAIRISDFFGEEVKRVFFLSNLPG